MSTLAVEFGFKAHEKGWNLEKTLMEYQALTLEEETKTPAWRSDPFTDEDRDRLVEIEMENIRDSAKEEACDNLDHMSLMDIFPLFVDDLEMIVDCLKAIRDGNADMDDYESGEFEEHVEAAKTIRKFNLEKDGELTDLGRQVIEEFS